MDVIKLEELDIYQLALDVGERIWNIVDLWEWFPKKTVGTQLVTAADSIASNISEGYGRYFYKDRKQFCYYSRGSLLETKNWITKAANRCACKTINTVPHIEWWFSGYKCHPQLFSNIELVYPGGQC
ncbi:MAG: four helix bundle protein [Ferruginibacter sp.]|nr:four helix bundle protein [Ferruginibacter sp.]